MRSEKKVLTRSRPVDNSRSHLPFFSCLGGLTSKLGDAAHACRGHVKLIFRHNSYPSLRLLRDHNCDFHFLQTICARCLSMILTFLYTIFIGSDYVLRQVVVPRIAGISQQVCFNGDSLWLVSSSED